MDDTKPVNQTRSTGSPWYSWQYDCQLIQLLTFYAIDITDLLKKIINDYQFCFLPLEANDPKVKPQDI